MSSTNTSTRRKERRAGRARGRREARRERESSVKKTARCARPLAWITRYPISTWRCGCPCIRWPVEEKEDAGKQSEKLACSTRTPITIRPRRASPFRASTPAACNVGQVRLPHRSPRAPTCYSLGRTSVANHLHVHGSSIPFALALHSHRFRDIPPGRPAQSPPVPRQKDERKESNTYLGVSLGFSSRCRSGKRARAVGW